MTLAQRITLLAVLVTGAGCAKKPAEALPTDTGAKSAAAGFFEALGRSDGAAAYALIAGKDVTREEFMRRAERYRKALGFDIASVHVTSCEERGDDATAHIVLNGKGHGRHNFKDTIILHRTDGAWRIVLSPKFGK